jgi:hypothetical protein
MLRDWKKIGVGIITEPGFLSKHTLTGSVYPIDQ